MFFYKKSAVKRNKEKVKVWTEPKRARKTDRNKQTQKERELLDKAGVQNKKNRKEIIDTRIIDQSKMFEPKPILIFSINFSKLTGVSPVFEVWTWIIWTYVGTLPLKACQSNKGDAAKEARKNSAVVFNSIPGINPLSTLLLMA